MPVQQTEHPHERGESTLDTGSLARDAVGEAAGGRETETVSPGTQHTQPRDESPELAEFEEGKPGEVEGTEPRPNVEGQTEQTTKEARQDRREVVSESAERHTEEPETEAERQEAIEEAAPEEGQQLTDEDFAELQELGVELPMRPSEVPAEMQDAYADLVQEVISAETRAAEVQAEATEQIMRVRDFAQRMQENPDQLLLSMAIEDPETFSEVSQEFQRMQQDPDYAEQKRRELAAEQKMREAERKERSLTQQERTRKAKRLRSQVRRKAKRLGVDPDRAEVEVANAAKRKAYEQDLPAPDISSEEAGQVVENLAELAGKPARKQTRERTQQTKSPETAETEQTAPTQQTEGRSRESQSTVDQDEAPQSGGIGSRIVRDAVREASRNVRSRGQ